MSVLLSHLAQFPPRDRDSWRADVDKTLKGRSFDEALVRQTIDGLSLQPLYTREDLPAGGDAGVPIRRGWTRCVEIDHPDMARANSRLLSDLEGGAERVIVHVVSARRALSESSESSDSARALAASGRGGIWDETASDLDVITRGVLWDLAPISVLASVDDARELRLFETCAAVREQRGHGGLSVQLDLLAHAWSGPDDASWLDDCAAEIAAETQRASRGTIHAADARPIGIDTRMLRHRGADFLQEIAAALGVFVAAARALDRADVTPEAVLRATEFRVGVGSDFFGEIAKLRAFRRCLVRVLEVMNIADGANDAMITAATAEETLTTQDVYTNLVRTTAQATAAALGGADSIIVTPFDARLQGGSSFGRRLARNVHSLLAEESDVAFVADPAAGSFYIEHQTEQIAEAAWRQFTEWERAGGFLEACRQGLVAAALDERSNTRAEWTRTGRTPVLGVTIHPPSTDVRPAAESFDVDAFVQQWRNREVHRGRS